MRNDQFRHDDRKRAGEGRNGWWSGEEDGEYPSNRSQRHRFRKRDFSRSGIDDERFGFDRNEHLGRDRDDNRYGRESGYGFGGGYGYGAFEDDPSEAFGRSDRGRERRDQGTWESIKENVKDFFGIGPEGYRRSDERIKEDVSEALMRDRSVDASRIRVEVSEGVVTLRGSVGSRWMKRQAEDCIEDLSGVDDVKNELTVRKEGRESGSQQITGSAMSGDQEAQPSGFNKVRSDDEQATDLSGTSNSENGLRTSKGKKERGSGAGASSSAM